MLDGIWRVYNAQGEYIGTFQTRVGNDVLMLDLKTAKELSTGTILHMDETHTKRAWIVELGAHFEKRENEFFIKLKGTRPEQYPKP